MSESGSPKKITIHTDGACDGNPGPGGWAALLRYGTHVRELAGGEPAITNNRMEIQASLSALTVPRLSQRGQDFWRRYAAWSEPLLLHLRPQPLQRV
jgi:hypothetical protein